MRFVLERSSDVQLKKSPFQVARILILKMHINYSYKYLVALHKIKPLSSTLPLEIY